jgi:hypothetical protein
MFGEEGLALFCRVDDMDAIEDVACRHHSSLEGGGGGLVCGVSLMNVNLGFRGLAPPAK